jgi:uncharacterized membrane protein
MDDDLGSEILVAGVSEAVGDAALGPVRKRLKRRIAGYLLLAVVIGIALYLLFYYLLQ